MGFASITGLRKFVGARNVDGGKFGLVASLLAFFFASGCVSPVSVTSTGEFGDGRSFAPAVSANGRFVAFESMARNLDPNLTVPASVPRDGSGGTTVPNKQIYVRDLHLETTEIASLTSTGQPVSGVVANPSISRDGCVVTFQTNANDVVPSLNIGIVHVYARNRCTNTTTLLSRINNGYRFSRGGWDASPILDGRGAYFVSSAFSGQGNLRIFLHHFSRATTTEFNAGFAPVPGSQPVTNNLGGWVGFISRSALAHVDRDGRSVAAGPNLQWPAVYVWARQNLIRVSPDVAGASRNPSMAPFGVWVAFESDGLAPALGNPMDTNNAPDIYVFNSWAYQHPDQYRFPRLWLYRASVSSDFDLANGASRNPAMSDGERVAFESDATNLAPDDTNGQTDIFLREIDANETHLISRSYVFGIGGGPGNGHSTHPSISANGKVIAFQSEATNFVPVDRMPRSRPQIYVYEEFEFAWPWRWFRRIFSSGGREARHGSG